MEEMFDFGFTVVNEEELDAVQMAKQDAAGLDESLEHVQGKLDTLFNAIIPLLNNLKQNPEKDYILWPDRLAKVESFEDHLHKIYKG